MALSWTSYLSQLKLVEKLLKDVIARERFQSVLNPADRKLERLMLANWNHSLGGLRWQAIVDFVTHVPRFEQVCSCFADGIFLSVCFFARYVQSANPLHHHSQCVLVCSR